MKITPDRLAVARAVRKQIESRVAEYPRKGLLLSDIRHLNLDAIIVAIPEPEPEPLPAPTGPDMCAHNAAHKSEWWWARERKTRLWHMARVAFPRPSPKGDDVLIASPISGFSNTLRNRGDFDAWLPLVAPTAKGGE